MFLGGMNVAMMLLCIKVLRARCAGGLFDKAAERRILFEAIAVGHFSQFVINVPSFLLKYKLAPVTILARLLSIHGMTPEDVKWVQPDKTMHFIFGGDFLAFVLNLYCAKRVQ